MKYLVPICMLVMCIFLNSHAQDKKKKENRKAPDIVFETEVVDYGTIEQNSNGVREFKFKNTGKEPLIITSCRASCGCTVPTCPKEPIKRGKTGIIKVKYSTNRLGRFSKTITVTSNAKTPRKVLTIKGDVIRKKVDIKEK